MQSLKDIANEIRIDLVKLHNRTHTPHIGSEFSCIDILVVLYFEIMDVTPENFKSIGRDYFVLSKGHAAPALYDILYRKGFISDEIFNSYGTNGSALPEHPKREIFGVDVA
ncbi:MAG: hypothetical protein QXP36_13455, partial [Conexivisphaerales archaeon]